MLPDSSNDGMPSGTDIYDPTANLAIKREFYHRRMEMVVKAALEADKSIWQFIFESVTKELSYAVMQTRGIPCSRDYFYDRYRKFFFILDKIRE